MTVDVSNIKWWWKINHFVITVRELRCSPARRAFRSILLWILLWRSTFRTPWGTCEGDDLRLSVSCLFSCWRRFLRSCRRRRRSEVLWSDSTFCRRSAVDSPTLILCSVALDDEKEVGGTVFSSKLGRGMRRCRRSEVLISLASFPSLEATRRTLVDAFVGVLSACLPCLARRRSRNSIEFKYWGDKHEWLRYECIFETNKTLYSGSTHSSLINTHAIAKTINIAT